MTQRKHYPREDLAHRFPELVDRPLCVGQVVVYAPEPETTSGFVCDIVYSGVDAGGHKDEFSNSWVPDIAPFDRYEIEWAEGAAPRPKGLQGFVAPIVRRVNYQAVAKQLVSIQPMTVPAGGVFYMDYKYGGSPVESITSGNPKKRRKKKAG